MEIKQNGERNFKMQNLVGVRAHEERSKVDERDNSTAIVRLYLVWLYHRSSN